MFNFYKKDGVCNASTNEKKLEMFSHWLQSDIQANETILEIYLDNIRKVKNGKLVQYEQTGNMFTLSINLLGAKIIFDDEYSDDEYMESASMPLDELIELLSKWNSFIRKNIR